MGGGEPWAEALIVSLGEACQPGPDSRTAGSGHPHPGGQSWGAGLPAARLRARVFTFRAKTCFVQMCEVRTPGHGLTRR